MDLFQICFKQLLEEVVTSARFHYLRICFNQLEGEIGESRESAEQVEEGRLGKATGGASRHIPGGRPVLKMSLVLSKANKQ